MKSQETITCFYLRKESINSYFMARTEHYTDIYNLKNIIDIEKL